MPFSLRRCLSVTVTASLSALPRCDCTAADSRIYTPPQNAFLYLIPPVFFFHVSLELAVLVPIHFISFSVLCSCGSATCVQDFISTSNLYLHYLSLFYQLSRRLVVQRLVSRRIPGSGRSRFYTRSVSFHCLRTLSLSWSVKGISYENGHTTALFVSCRERTRHRFRSYFRT